VCDADDQRVHMRADVQQAKAKDWSQCSTGEVHPNVVLCDAPLLRVAGSVLDPACVIIALPGQRYGLRYRRWPCCNVQVVQPEQPASSWEAALMHASDAQKPECEL